MGIKAPGNSSRGAAPYSRAFSSFGAAVDLTEAAVSGGASGSPAAGARRGASGVILIVKADGTFTWRDAAGVQSSVALVAAGTPRFPLPFCVTEISSFTGAGNLVIAYWHD